MFNNLLKTAFRKITYTEQTWGPLVFLRTILLILINIRHSKQEVNYSHKKNYSNEKIQ